MKKIIITSTVLLALILSVCAQQKKNPPPPKQQAPVPSAATQVVLASAFTNATATPTNTPLTFNLAGNTTYTMLCALYFSGTSTVMQVAVTGPANPVTIGYSFDHVLVGALSGGQNNIATSFGTLLGLPNNTPTPNQRLNSFVTLGVTTGTTAGNITVQAAAPSGTITIYPGSFCRLQ